MQPDGKILAAGIHHYSGGYDFALARYNGNGTLDGSFGGGDGRVTTDFSGYGRANALVIRRDGKIVVAGHGIDSSFGDFALARYNPNGTLDRTFDGDGRVFTSFRNGYDAALAVTVHRDGRVVAAGSSERVNFVTDVYEDDFALARYTAE